LARSISAPTPASSASANGVAQANTAWKITNSSANRIGGPSQACSSTLSSAAWSRCTPDSLRIAPPHVARGKAPLGQREVLARMGLRIALGPGLGAGHRLAQRVEPALAHRDGRDHRHAERPRQRLGIEHQPVALGEVGPC
jgi:hypothetical protein